MKGEVRRIVTTLGTRCYPLESRLYASLGGNGLYFPLQVDDISEDTMILWRNEHIDADFEEILPHLLRSPRYRQARETVMTENSKGEEIPVFRIELIKALAGKGVISEGSLEQKIMKEEGDFSPKQYSAMRGYLLEGLAEAAGEDESLARSRYAINKWLKGEAVCVTSPQLLKKIAEITGSEAIREWHAGAEKKGKASTGYWREYKLYNSIRQTVTRNLHRNKGELARLAEKQSSPDSDSFDITLETRIVLEQFMERVNEKFSLARVLRTERVRISEGTAEDSHSLLADGAYRGAPTGDMTTLSLQEIVDETNFFDSVVAFAVRQYLTGISSGKTSRGKTAKIAVRAFYSQTNGDFYFEDRLAHYLVLNVMKNLGLSNKKVAQKPELVTGLSIGLVAENIGDAMPDIRDYIAISLEQDIISGKIDRALKIPRHWVYRAIKHLGNLERAEPAIYEEYRQLRLESDRKIEFSRMERPEKRVAKIRMEHVERQLRTRYGFSEAYTKSFFLPTFLYTSWKGNFDMIAQKHLNSGHIDEKTLTTYFGQVIEKLIEKAKGVSDPEFVRKSAEMANAYKTYGQLCFTSQEASEILLKHGLPELYRLIPQANFAFEESPIKPKKSGFGQWLLGLIPGGHYATR